MPETWHTDYTTPGFQAPDSTGMVEFCGAYKGDHEFDQGSETCRCGRAFKRTLPRPLNLARPRSDDGGPNDEFFWWMN